MHQGSARGDSVWGIAAYFNPLRSPLRRCNYAGFRSRLAVPLLTVELALDDGLFELESGDAEILVRRRGKDVLWQKERLLNLALAELPAECRTVVWLDADVVFADARWIDQLDRALEEYAIVQPFARLHLLPRGAAPASHPGAIVRHSAVAAFSQGLAITEWMRRFGDHRGQKVGLGYAWGARRALLERHGLYDKAIIGGGDRAMLCAATGHFAELVEKHRLNPRQAQNFLNWARPFHADVGGRLGWLEGDLYHLWHGDIEGRQYAERHARLAEHDFDPETDLAIAEGGIWRWNSDKPALHSLLTEYFAARMRAEARCIE